MTNTKNELISITALCKLLGRSRTTIWRWAKDETLPKPVYVKNNILGWKPEDISLWIDSQSER